MWMVGIFVENNNGIFFVDLCEECSGGWQIWNGMKEWKEKEARKETKEKVNELYKMCKVMKSRQNLDETA